MTRQIVLNVSPVLYGRMESRATVDRVNLHEWLLRTVISELLRPEAELASERRARADLAAMPFSSSAQSMNERKSHASHL